MIVVQLFQAALDFEDPALQALIESLPEAPAAARRQCLKMCGMDTTGDDDLSYDYDYDADDKKH